MALNLFPATPLISWSVSKDPNWNTQMQRAITGRELRTSNYVLPLYKLTIMWEILRDLWDIRAGYGVGAAFPLGATPYDELRTILEFFNQQQGANIPFRYLDPADNTTRAVPATPQIATFAIGDGVTMTFQMASGLLAAVIPNVVTSVIPAIGFSTDSNTGNIIFTAAPSNGTPVGADFTFWLKVRFSDDYISAENFAYQFWQLKSVKLTSVIE